MEDLKRAHLNVVAIGGGDFEKEPGQPLEGPLHGTGKQLKLNLWFIGVGAIGVSGPIGVCTPKKAGQRLHKVRLLDWWLTEGFKGSVE